MLGARATLELTDGTVRVARSRTDASYCSARDPRIVVGLTDGVSVRQVRVDWPDGLREDFGVVESGRYTPLVQGTGQEPGQ